MALRSSMEATDWAVYIDDDGGRRIIGRVHLAYKTSTARLRYAADYRLPTGGHIPAGTYASPAGGRRALVRRYERRLATMAVCPACQLPALMTKPPATDAARSPGVPHLGMVRRVLQLAGTRCADADPEDLTQLLTIGRELDAAIQSTVDGMRDAHGFSWADVGRAAGVTRQAAQQRWGTPAPQPADPEKQ